eukprot:scaffold57925_cov15-Tisochrysis_lutea.AAC.1
MADSQTHPRDAASSLIRSIHSPAEHASPSMPCAGSSHARIISEGAGGASPSTGGAGAAAALLGAGSRTDSSTSSSSGGSLPRVVQGRVGEDSSQGMSAANATRGSCSFDTGNIGSRFKETTGAVELGLE